jgi:DNA-directed RNA polymerase specialized sigma24 family protein
MLLSACHKWLLPYQFVSLTLVQKVPGTPTLASPYDTALEAEQNLMCKKVRALIDDLPLERRTLLEMAYFSGMTHSEIADRTGFPLGTIKTRIRDALKNLRKDLRSRSRSPGMRSRNP